MRQPLVVPDAHGHLPRMPPGEIAVAQFVTGLAAAEQNELHVLTQHRLQRGQLDVHTFLIHEAVDAAEQRNLVIHRQAEFFLQFHLVGEFAVQVCRRVFVLEKKIVGGLPFVVIHTVQNADQMMITTAQQALESAAKFRRGNLPGVSRADGGHGVREKNSRLQTVELAVKLRAFRFEITPRKIRQRELRHRKLPLIRQVVNRQTGARRVGPATGIFFMLDQQRHQPDMPVVNVDKLRLPRQVPRKMHRRLGQENKSLGVVVIIKAAVGIKSRALIKLRLINEVNRQAGNRLQGADLSLNAPSAQRQIQHPVERFEAGKFFTNPGVQWRDQSHLMPLARQGFGQRADHVPQPARLRVRVNFAAG